MKLALVAPNFPPDHCGVGDYTARFAAEAARQGHKVRVWTAQAAPRVPRGVETRHVARPWGFSGLARVRLELRLWKPDAVLVQYTPYLYGPRTMGIQPLLPGWLASLKSAGAPVALVSHENHYPVGLTPTRLLIGVPQFAIFQALTLAADQVFFTLELARDRYARRFPWRRERFAWFPVGAGIDPRGIERPPVAGEERELLRSARVPERHKLLLQFGGAHPTRVFGLAFAALEEARHALGPDSTSLVFVGIGRETVEAELARAGKMDLAPLTHALGYLPDWQASLLLRRADLVLAPFIDGVSARRSSVMTALAHGRPVVTTRGWWTDPSAGWESSCAVAPAAEEFPALAARLLKDPVEAARVAEAGRRAYDERFDWAILVREALARLGGGP